MRVHANGLEFEVDCQGPPGGEPLLLIMGLGMQLVAWPEELVADLVRRGFRVVRMDNRDVGLSQHLDRLGLPSVVRAALRHSLRLPVHAPYSVRDMAEDARAVLDQLGIRRAHVCGASMGGMIAQHLAARHPERVKSLTLVMTTSGARQLPQPRPLVTLALLAQPRRGTVAARVGHVVRLMRLIGSPAYRPDPVRQRRRIEATVRRSWHPQGTMRQLMAVVADGDRSALLGRISAPTRVFHGEEDPLVPVAAAHDLARQIQGAVLETIPGMGHDLPEALLPRLAAAIADNAARAPAEPAQRRAA